MLVSFQFIKYNFYNFNYPMSAANLTGVAYDDVINAIQRNLPCLPQILEELIKRLSDIESSIESIEELVRIDQAISTRILKVSTRSSLSNPMNRASLRSMTPCIKSVWKTPNAFL